MGFDYATFSDHVVIPTDIAAPNTPTAIPANSPPGRAASATSS